MKRKNIIITKWLVFLSLFIVLYLRLGGVAPYLFLASSLGFGIGFILRILGKYPGIWEPLILDLWGGIFSLFFFYLARKTKHPLIPFLFFIVILPHFLYLLHNYNRLDSADNNHDNTSG